MSNVVLVYGGQRYTLATSDIVSVHFRITERLNHSAHYRDRIDRRPFGQEQGSLQDFPGGPLLEQFDPFEVFELADGGEVWVACYDGVDLALESASLRLDRLLFDDHADLCCPLPQA
ncbi:hypothetical protein [Corynebacterium rouxii]|uniref:Uncharacterized protein n=1 Tax=Corynebacterium rouxii TaxID=2719119 RepID=A0A6I8MF74_9CORY|nr:hypothetical protein [Corynebacterium rouxii]VZH84156.1 hypothetical protein FRC0190_00194 [Corynebacterium rouxii]